MARNSRLVRLLGAALVACLLAIASHAFGASGGGREGAARATGYGVILDSGSLAGVSADSTGIRSRSTSAAGLGGGTVGTVGNVAVEVIARPEATTGDAGGSVSASGLNLFGGRVTVAQVRVDARATAPLGAEPSASASVSVVGLVVDGVATPAGPGSSIGVPGAGVVTIGEIAPQGPGATRVNGLRAVITDAAAGTPGASLVVGYLDVSATAGEHPPAPAQPAKRPSLDPEPGVSPGSPAVPRDEEPEPRRERVPPAAQVPDAPSAPVDAPPATPAEEVPVTPVVPQPRLLPGTPGAPGVTLTPPGSGFAFPVAGQFSYGDDFGAPRAVTGSHQGNDIFAPVGTPVVAVSDGVISQVGVNTLGGNRLWLEDSQGNAFYYAHLSAYAPSTTDGARVQAGQVIAYVGNTGQAITTPPHLHFEVHPGGKDAPSTDPYPLLRVWEGNPGATSLLQVAGPQPLPDAAAGAVLVGVEPSVEESLPAGDGRATSAR